jgi:hypothetical protein
VAVDPGLIDQITDDDELKKRPQPQQPQPQQSQQTPQAPPQQAPPPAGPVGQPLGAGGQPGAPAPQPQPQPVVDPVGKPLKTPQAAPIAAPPVTPPGMGDSGAAAIQSTIGQPLPNIPAPRPAGQAAEALAAQGPPQLHGWRRALDTIAGATKIGSAVEQAGGWGSKGYDTKLGRAQEAAGVEESQIAAGEKEREANATAEEKSSIAQKNEASIGTVPVTINGETYHVPQKDMEKLIGTGITTNSAEKRNENTVQGAADRQQTQLEATRPLLEARQKLAEAQAKLATMKADPNSPIYARQAQMVELAQQRMALTQKEFEYNYEPFDLTPQESAMLPHDEAGGVIPLKSPQAPTAQTRSRGQMAAVTAADFPKIYAQIDKLASKIGPGAGRWNEFWVNKAGIDDPDFANLDSTLDATASGLAITHFGARGGGQQYIAQMKKDLGEAQSPADLKARLAAWNDKMAQYAKAAGVRTGGGNNPPTKGGGEPERPANVPNGFVYNEKGPKGAGWYRPTK